MADADHAEEPVLVADRLGEHGRHGRLLQHALGRTRPVAVVVHQQRLALLGGDARGGLTQAQAARRDPGGTALPGLRGEHLLLGFPDEHGARWGADEHGRPIDDQVQQRRQVALAGQLRGHALHRFQPPRALLQRLFGRQALALGRREVVRHLIEGTPQLAHLVWEANR